MASSTFTGFEIGTYSVKALTIDENGEPEVIDYAEEVIPSVETETESSDEEAAKDQSSADATQSTEEPSSPHEDETRQLEAWEHALKQIHERDFFDKSGPTVTYLPTGQIMSVRLSVPFGERDKVENVLPHLLDDHLPLSPDELIYDFHLQKKFDVDEDADETHEVIVGFARRQNIGAFLDKLSTYELDPAVIGAPQLLLSWLSETLPEIEHSKTNAFIDIGHRYTRILIKQGDRIGLSRSIRKGGEKITKAITENLDKTPEQADHLKKTEGEILENPQAHSAQKQKLDELIRGELTSLLRELGRTFQSLKADTGLEVDQIYLTGGTSQLAGLSAHLESTFEIPVQKVSIDNFYSEPDIPAEQMDKDWSTVGLPFAMSTQQLYDSRSEATINLRKEEFEYRGKSSYIRQQLIRYGSVFAGLFILMLGILWTRSMELSAQKNAMKQAVETQTKQLFDESISDHTQIQKRLAGKTKQKRAFIPKMSAYQLYYKLMSQIPEDFDFETEWVEVDLSRNLVQMRGETESIQAMEQLKTYFGQIDCINNVQDEDVSTDAENRASFELQIQSGCS